MSENSVNAFQMAQQQFDQVADMLKLDKPVREFHFKIPVRMYNGEYEKAQDSLTQQVIDLSDEEVFGDR